MNKQSLIKFILKRIDDLKSGVKSKGTYFGQLNPEYPFEHQLQKMTKPQLEVFWQVIKNTYSKAFSEGYKSSSDFNRTHINAGLVLEKLKVGTGKNYKPKAHKAFQKRYSVEHWTKALPKNHKYYKGS